MAGLDRREVDAVMNAVRRLARLGAGLLLAAGLTGFSGDKPFQCYPGIGCCFEDIGCTSRDAFKYDSLTFATCDWLWTMRNAVYKGSGYCFHTPHGITVFGNAGCQYDAIDLVPLNAIERANIATIEQVEASKNCR
jgi:YARHG domain